MFVVVVVVVFGQICHQEVEEDEKIQENVVFDSLWISFICEELT